ncbi:MAG TPA: type II toxin-antitoxin system VapB family antitoxin [Pararhizobium sp.]|uniref:type II toxin-antitoxin system VapB family antitoxin n=1 Tax=Pararhizobium sp. TaxID=1977563 RepID=UPI002BA6D98E|nr:type II toxin-antitoxin system VapB family antitoxin [Pararhizobium sp.]HTO33184.1 type II toxin-antitoxin system VapB family antitoxin [Pararhizobium sp.]
MFKEIGSICVTVVLDGEMLKRAQIYTGLTTKSAVIRHALQSLTYLEAGKKLAELGGSQPDLEDIPRRRPWADGESE